MSSVPVPISDQALLETATPEQVDIARNILRILLTYRRIPKDELLKQKNHKYGVEDDSKDIIELYPHQYNPILHSVVTSTPVNLNVLGFPAKSSNFLKVASFLPDTGERMVMHMFHRLCNLIREIHPHGAFFTICSDGHAFQPYLRITDENVTEYNTRLREMAAEDGLTNIKFFDLSDVYGKGLSAPEYRRLFDEEFGPTWADLDKLQHTDTEIKRTLTEGFQVFLREEVIGFGLTGRLQPDEYTAEGFEKAAIEGAMGIMKMSRGWGRACASKLHNYVRTSVHPQEVGAPKFGIRTLGSLRNRIWNTPWHCIPLFRSKEDEQWCLDNLALAGEDSALGRNNDRVILVRNDEAVRLGAVPVYKGGQIIHFVCREGGKTIEDLDDVTF